MATKVAEANGSFKRNPGRKNRNEPVPRSDEPEMPEIVAVCPHASKAWTEACDCLRDTGILSATDLHLLTSYAITTGEYFKLARRIQLDGYENEKGSSSGNAVAFFKVAAQHAKLLSELGLSPSSRTKLSVEKPSRDEEDSIERVFRELRSLE